MKSIEADPNVRAARERARSCQVRLNELRQEERELRNRCAKAPQPGSVPTRVSALVDDGAEGSTFIMDDRADAAQRLADVRAALQLQEDFVTEARREQANVEYQAARALVNESAAPAIRRVTQQVADSLQRLHRACAEHRQLGEELEAAGVSLGGLGRSEWAPFLNHLGDWAPRAEHFDLAARWLDDVRESGLLG